MCKACQNRINGMARRRKGKFADHIQTAAAAGAGFVAGQVLTNKVSFLQTNTWAAVAAKVSLGAFVAGSSKNKMVQGAGVGLATSGVVQGIGEVMPEGVAGLPAGSAGFHYVAGPGKRQTRVQRPMAMVN